MDNGMPMTPAEYEVHDNNELERDKKRDERWNKMLADNSLRKNFEMLEQLSGALDIDRNNEQKRLWQIK